MQCLLIANAVLEDMPAVLQLFSLEDQPLLVGRNALLVLDLPFQGLNQV
jgi:hypothetical protein